MIVYRKCLSTNVIKTYLVGKKSHFHQQNVEKGDFLRPYTGLNKFNPLMPGGNKEVTHT